MPSIRFPENPEGKKIALQMIGGIGDSLIVAGASNVCPVTIVVRDAFVPVLNELENVTAVSPSQFRKIEGEYDVICNMMGTFVVVRTLRDQEYYSLVSDRIGHEIGPPQFKKSIFSSTVPKTAYLHATASDRNRNWDRDYWATVAVSLREAGCKVYWLGVDHDFGFSDDGIEKLSDKSGDLLWQVQQLATADLFLGIDSGFIHLAGILGLRGYGLFFNSRSSNVIGKYQTLEGIDEFCGGEPPRTIGVPCEASKRNAKTLTPDRLLSKLGIKQVNVKASDFEKNKPEIGIINYSEEIAGYLEGYTCVPEKRLVTLYPGEDGEILISTPNGENIFRAPLIHLQRAIRELLWKR